MRVIVIGGGAAGMMAAYSAKNSMNMVTSSDNDEVILIEKNEKLGKKIFITGKGRGNITNNCDKDTFFSNIIRNPKFFNSAFSKFSNIDTMNFFTDNGLKIKTERGNRVFPELDKAFLITDTLKKVLNRIGVKMQDKAWEQRKHRACAGAIAFEYEGELTDDKGYGSKIQNGRKSVLL